MSCVPVLFVLHCKFSAVDTPSIESSTDINRLNATTTLTTLNKTKPRICILSVTEDASSQYVPIMNCIFSAQKNVCSRFPCLPFLHTPFPFTHRLSFALLKKKTNKRVRWRQSIPIDVCKIYGPDAVFLQQACHLTLGNYFKIMKRNSLLQYLIVSFLFSSFLQTQSN